MYEVIDCPWDAGRHASALRAAGVETVFRYYNMQNSRVFPHKCLTAEEASQLFEAGLSIGTVFEQGGGANGNISELDAAQGRANAARALELARGIGQPHGSAIYFTVDHDYADPDQLAQIKSYFEAVREVLGEIYRVGVYGSGLISTTMRSAGLADLIWLPAATGWAGTEAALQAGTWDLRQDYPPGTWAGGAFTYDGDIIRPGVTDYGQFSRSSAQAAVPHSRAGRGRDQRLPPPVNRAASAAARRMALDLWTVSIYSASGSLS